MTTITPWPPGISFYEYLSQTKELAKTGKTSGSEQSDSLIHYTKLNASRMRRISKTTPLNTELVAFLTSGGRQYLWRVFTETWCGDAAQSLPVMEKVAQAAGTVEIEVLFRDENPALFDRYLTNGTRSIPKLVIFDKQTGEELGSWGPRPTTAQEMVMAYKAAPTKPYSEFSEDLQRWYNTDKGQQIQAEILQALRSFA